MKTDCIRQKVHNLFKNPNACGIKSEESKFYKSNELLILCLCDIAEELKNIEKALRDKKEMDDETS